MCSCWKAISCAAAVAVLAFGVYLSTLAPGLTWAHDGADGGDLAAAVAVGGVPHPTGYPSYLVIAELFRRLPWGDVAYRLNLMSATLAALAAGGATFLTWFVVPTLPTSCRGRACASAMAGSLFALSPILWSQAVITEVYALAALFAVGTLTLAVWAGGGGDAPIALTYLCLGVALGAHLTLALLVPSLVWLHWSSLRRRPTRYLTRALPAVLLGTSVYMILPLRAAAQPPINWGDASTLDGLLWLVSGSAYRSRVVGLEPVQLLARLVPWLRTMFETGNWAGTVLAVVGAIAALRSDRRLGGALLLAFGFFSAYAICYDTTDSYVYLIPALAVLCVCAGYGAALAFGTMHGIGRLAVAVAILLIAVSGGPLRWQAMDLSHDTVAIDWVRQALAVAPESSTLRPVGDAETFALWYAQYGLKMRPDVQVLSASLGTYAWYPRVHP